MERSQLDISDPYKVYRIVPEGAKKGGLAGLGPPALTPQDGSLSGSCFPFAALYPACLGLPFQPSRRFSQLLWVTS